MRPGARRDNAGRPLRRDNTNDTTIRHCHSDPVLAGCRSLFFGSYRLQELAG